MARVAEFHKKQAMRMSTARTPRVISCAEDFAQHVAVPRGCLSDVTEILRTHGIALDIEDKRTEGAEIDVKFGGTLTPIQQDAADALVAHEIGVLVAPPGVGKTVIGTYLVAARRRSTLVLVHRVPLMDPWRSQLAIFLGIEPKQIGQIGAGKERVTSQVDIAMIPTLARREDPAELVAGYGHVIVDECHHVSAVSYERVVAATKARYVVGLTATPKRRDGHHPITASTRSTRARDGHPCHRHRLAGAVDETDLCLASRSGGDALVDGGDHRAAGADVRRLLDHANHSQGHKPRTRAASWLR